MKKRTAIRAISFLAAGVVALSAVSVYHYSRAEGYRRHADAGFQRAFAELCTSVSGLDAALQKSLYATSPTMVSAVCTEVFGKAMTAQMSLGVLPFSTQELEQTAGFISRVGDYAYTLSRTAASGEPYSDEQLRNLRELSQTATLLSRNLTDMQAGMHEGKLSMDKLLSAEKQADEAEHSVLGEGTVGGSLRLIEQEFPETPSLIYDGPFSAHLSRSGPRCLEGAEEISADLAKKIAASFLGLDNSSVRSCEEAQGEIPAWRVCLDTEHGEACVLVSVRGGMVLGLLSEYRPSGTQLSADEATTIAKRFLRENGYPHMRESYHMIRDNVITINFAHEQDGVLCYPDLVKVSLSLDDGAVLGFDSLGYVNSHYERKLPVVTVSVDEARKLVAKDLDILSEGLCVIPSAGGEELLCHEFKCQTQDERHYIVYVNAVTGVQEKILILLEDESGALAL